MKSLSRQVRRLRLEAGLTAVDLERKAGVPYGTVSRIEQGKHNHMADTYNRVLLALGYTVSIVRIGEGSPA